MQKFSVDAVIFDLDGTLTDTLEDLKNSVNYAVELCGGQPYDLETVRSFIGSGAANLIRQALQNCEGDWDFDDILTRFRNHYMDHVMDNTCAYPGIKELLSELKAKGKKLAVTSNKPDKGTKAIVDAIFPDVFDYVAGEKADVPRKPAPDMVKNALSALNTEKALYIGDSDVDVETARNSGLPCVCVTWGYRDVDQLKAAGGEIFVYSAKELGDRKSVV